MKATSRRPLFDGSVETVSSNGSGETAGYWVDPVGAVSEHEPDFVVALPAKVPRMLIVPMPVESEPTDTPMRFGAFFVALPSVQEAVEVPEYCSSVFEDDDEWVALTTLKVL